LAFAAVQPCGVSGDDRAGEANRLLRRGIVNNDLSQTLSTLADGQRQMFAVRPIVSPHPMSGA
jgi:hypothetical protein